jgi:hypothetical protein
MQIVGKTDIGVYTQARRNKLPRGRRVDAYTTLYRDTNLDCWLGQGAI